MVEPTGELTVTYTLRELLEGIKSDLSTISHKLDGKADRADLAELRREIDDVKRDVADIKLWRAKVAGISAAIGALVGGGAGMVLRLVGG